MLHDCHMTLKFSCIIYITDAIFKVTGFEVRAKYLKSRDEQLNDICLNGGRLSGETLKQNYSQTSSRATIVSGAHGLIKLIRPDVFCVYSVNVSQFVHVR